MLKPFIVFASVVAVLVGGCFIVQKQPSKTPQTVEKLTIATVDYAPFALMYIAQNQGYFKEEGLDVTYKTFPKGIDSLTAALKGDFDLGLANETPAVRKIYEGEKLRIISTLQTSTKNTAIIGRKDKGILTVNDLRGKKIGVALNSSYEFFLYSFLVSHGISFSDVVLVDGDLASMSTLLTDGTVDAVATGNIYLYDAQRVFPPELLSTFQSEVYTENSVIAGREDIVKNKKEAIARFLRALVKAEKYYTTNNKEALDAVVAELPGVSEDSIRGTWNQFTPTLRLDNVLLTLLTREGQWLEDSGIYKNEFPDFKKAIFTDYLKSIKPEAVTLY